MIVNTVTVLSRQLSRLCHRNSFLKVISVKMSAKPGDTLPSVDLYEDNPTNKVNLGDLCKHKKIIIFGVPGAFTPGCSKTHLPGYINKSSELRAQGVNEIVCVSVNDPFVMAAWGQSLNAAGKVRLLSDPNAEFTKKLQMAIDLPQLGGTRSKRYSMVIENCTIKSVQVEPDNTGLSCSLAENVKL